MSVVSRYLALSAFATVVLSASAANSAPLDDCRNFAAKAAIAPCTLIIDDSKENPGNRSYAHLLRARAEMDLSDLDKAEADIAAGLAARPGFAFGYRLRGRLRGLQDRPVEARADFTKALQLSDTPVLKYLAYLERGQFLTRIKEYPDALADLDAAIHLDGAKAMAYVSRAVVYREMGNIDAALASLEWAASVEPTYWLTYVERGDIMVAQKRFNEAVAAFDLALAQRPNDARAQRGRAAAVAAGGTAEAAKKPEAKPEEQTKLVTPAPQPAPAPPPAPAPAADAITQHGDSRLRQHARAAASCRDAAGSAAGGAQRPRRAPAPPGGQTADAPDPAGQAAEERKKKLQSALELRNGRKFAEALGIYEAMLKAVPTDLEVTIEKGRTLMQLARWPDAMNTFKAVIEAKGTSDNVKAVALANQGEILATVSEVRSGDQGFERGAAPQRASRRRAVLARFQPVSDRRVRRRARGFPAGRNPRPEGVAVPELGGVRADRHRRYREGEGGDRALARGRAGQCRRAARPRAAQSRGRRYRRRRGRLRTGHAS